MENNQIIEFCGKLWIWNIIISIILMFTVMAKDELVGNYKFTHLDGLYYRSLFTLPFTFSLLFFVEIIIPILHLE